MEITEFVPDKSYTVSCKSCGGECSSTFAFEKNGAGTHVVLNMQTRAISLFSKIMSPLTGLIVGPLIRKCGEQDLNLKVSIEGGRNRTFQ